MSFQLVNAFMDKGYLISSNLINKLKNLEGKNPEMVVNAILELNPPQIITDKFFDDNKKKLGLIFENLFSEEKTLQPQFFFETKIKLKKSEISREPQSFLEEEKDMGNIPSQEEKKGIKCKELARKVNESFEILSAPIIDNNKEIKVSDFVKYFKDRFLFLKKVLQGRTELQNLTSINKLSSQNKNISIIGMVFSKYITKNKNYLIEVEDLTGRVRVLIHKNRKELCKIAKEITLDEVIGIRASGNSEILFANEIVYPESILLNNKKHGADENVLIVSDLHTGNKKFLEEKFLKFVGWVNGEVGDEKQKEMAKKVKFILILGDVIDGSGVYPTQQNNLKIEKIGDQFDKFYELINKIRKDVTIIITPGNHDAIRLAEPQPQFDKKYAKKLYDMENVFLLTNPTTIKINSGKESFIFLLYHGYSIDYYYMNIDELRLKNAMHHPEVLMEFLFKRRHLAPTHASTLYIPYEKDNLVIRTVPDFFVMGHIHKSAVSKKNGTILISGSCWQELTDFEEKVGHEPDPCKVPIINLKNKSIKILDFS